MPNNIQTIIDKFKIKFPQLYTTCDGREGYDYLAEDDVVNFIQSSLTSLLDEKDKEIQELKNKIIKLEERIDDDELSEFLTGSSR